MAHGKYETPIDSKFVVAYETYNHQLEELERAHLRKRRSNAAAAAENGEPVEPLVVREEIKHPPNRDDVLVGERVTESNVMRYALSSILIGYTAALVYFMVADGKSGIGATRL
jgi:hypothetical protein